jgi:hypothetical protein
MAAQTDRSLFIVLGPRPWLHSCTAEGKEEIELDDTKYTLLERQVGFYDFLRNRQKVLIGLRFSFFKKEKILNDASALDYV